MQVLPTKRWRSPVLKLVHLGTVSRSSNINLPVTVSEAIGNRLIEKFYAVRVPEAPQMMSI